MQRGPEQPHHRQPVSPDRWPGTSAVSAPRGGSVRSMDEPWTPSAAGSGQIRVARVSPRARWRQVSSVDCGSHLSCHPAPDIGQPGTEIFNMPAITGAGNRPTWPCVPPPHPTAVLGTTACPSSGSVCPGLRQPAVGALLHPVGGQSWGHQCSVSCSDREQLPGLGLGADHRSRCLHCF